MSEAPIPTELYVGKAATLQAEIGTLPCYQGRWLVHPVGDGEWDAIACDTKAEAKELIAEMRGLWGWAAARIIWMD